MSERILVVRMSSMGDIVHALPAVASLRAAFPRARLDWLVEARWQELIETNPDLSNVIPVDTYAWRGSLFNPATWVSASMVVRGLRGIGYDLSLDFQGLYKSALFARLSGARERLGFAKELVRESGAARFYTRRIAPPANTHVIELNLALAKAAGAPESVVRFPLQARPEDDAAVEALLKQNQVREFFVLSPGGGWGAKRWPLERYAMVHNELARRRGWRAVVNAGPDEERQVGKLLAQARVTRPVPLALPMGQLIALLGRARLVISGDTGPLHLAAALGTPVVGLYGPTDPVRNGPYGPRAVVLHHREQARITYKHEDKPSPAMLAITVEEVLAAAERVLEASGG